MYESFFGLKEKPFSLLPDPAYLYLSKQHDMAMTLLEYSLENQAGFCVITGKAGMGKTTLMRRLLNRIGDDVVVGLITNTQHSFGELLHWVLHAFSLENSAKTRAELHQVFIDYLLRQYANNRRTMLIIDEAQNMSSDTLEELRMLSNVNSEKDLLLQIILVGQPPLRDLLSRPELEQFAQRIAVDYHLNALGRDETQGYIRHRVQVAGGEPGLFTDDACAAVFEYSRGIPRLINLLCDFSLVYAYAGEVAVVTGELVEQVIREREKNGALPIFAHERKNPAQQTPAAITADDAEAHVSRQEMHSGTTAEVRGDVARDGYRKAPPVSDVPTEHAAHTVMNPAVTEVPVMAATHRPDDAAVDEGVSVQVNMAPDVAEQRTQELPAPSRTKDGDSFGSVAAGETDLRAARVAVALRHGAKSERMHSVEMEQTQPAPSAPDAPPGQAATDKQAETVHAPQAAPAKTDDAEPADAVPPKPDATTSEGTIEPRHDVRAHAPVRRYVAAAAVIVLSSGAALAWHFFDRPLRQTAATSSVALQSPLGQATAAPAAGVMKDTAPVSESGTPADSPAKPSVMHQATVEPAIAVTAPVKEKNKPLAEQARVTGTITQARDGEREALREAVAAYQQSMAAEQVPAPAPESDRSNPPAQDAAKAQPDTHAAAPDKSGPLYPP